MVSKIRIWNWPKVHMKLEEYIIFQDEHLELMLVLYEFCILEFRFCPFTSNFFVLSEYII